MQPVDPQLIARFQFIDFLLLFKGRLTRTELVTRFGIGEATASRTIAAYIETYQNAMIFKGSRNGYEAAAGFIPASVHCAENGLRYIAWGKIDESYPVETFGPETINLKPDLNASLVATITRAIVNQHQVNIEYQSTTSGTKPRFILPHSLFEASSAWYFRAYDYSVSDYHTFKFTRVLSAISLGIPAQLSYTRNKDATWQRIRYVQLIAHPKSIHPDSYLLDLGMPATGIKELAVSEACLGFVLRDLRVDCSQTGKLDAREYPLRLVNLVELEDVESMAIAPGFQHSKA
ncbi:WYL domain-containing protein [Kluyvera intermedia]|uniref:WYL domain-containing protein n=1 Tax=Kluyvera intermedia TaxID=61648 RepID=UPI003525ACEC